MPNAFSGLLRSTVILGGSQLVQIGLSLVRMKVVALLLGPSGVGLLGVYNSLQSVVVTAAGLGVPSSGVKYIAQASSDGAALSKARLILFVSLSIQGALALLVLALFSSPLSIWLTGTSDNAMSIGCVGIAVLLALLAASQTTVLQGLRRTVDVARIGLLSGLAATVLGPLAVWKWSDAGLIALLVVQPLAAVFIASFFFRALPFKLPRPLAPGEYVDLWRAMAELGLVFMLGTAVTSATLLAVRAVIAQQLGIDFAGYFTAAWGLSSQMVALLLAPLASDYYPRVVSTGTDRSLLSDTLNAQTQLTLALGGPALLFLLGLASWLVTFLYSDEFSPAVLLLQWLALGNLPKLASWPLGYILVAKGNGRMFLVAEIGWNVAFGLISWFVLPHLGVIATGIGFFAANLLYLLLLAALVRRLYFVQYDASSIRLVVTLVAQASIALALSMVSQVIGALVALVFAVATLIVGVRLIADKTGSPSVGALLGRLRRGLDHE